MIRIKSDPLSPGSIPAYDFPNWGHDVFFVGEDGETVFKFGGKEQRVFVPEFEMWCEKSDEDLATKSVQTKVLKFISSVCVSLEMEDGFILMPIRSHMTLQGSGPGFISSIHFGLLLTHDPDPSEKHENHAPWVPTRVWNIKEFGEQIEQMMTVSDVMME